jgi:hypothetical protein
MSGAIEIIATKSFDHIGNGIFTEKHSTKNALLCDGIVGRNSLEAITALWKFGY